MTDEKKWPVREELPPIPEKTFKVVRSDLHEALFKIVYHEGGLVPSELREAYSKRSVAEAAIAHHIKHRKLRRNYASTAKGKENAKNKDKVRV